MKETITYRFNNFKRADIGAVPTLSRAVRGMKYGKQIINDAFRKFVPKDEYAQDERDMILEDLYTKSASSETPDLTLIGKQIKND
jgi:hypothetical protein